jgi:hypothetical protein
MTEEKNDWPPPPFKTEDLDYGPSWLILAILLILTGFALIGLAVFYMVS